MEVNEKCDVKVSYVRKRDLKEIMEIERQCFKQKSWTFQEVLELSKNKRVIAKVALKNESVVGFIFYSIKHDRVRIMNLAVQQDHRKEKIGTLLLEDLINKVNESKKKSVEILVRETNLDAQLFFKQNNFVCSEIKNDFFDDVGEAAYRMVYFVKK